MTEQKIKMINTELPDVVELRGVKQIYDGKPPTLEDVNLLIEATPNQGQFIVLLGPSGCGKCVAKGTWIVTSEGLRRIEDLFDSSECIPDSITKVSNGLQVKIGSKNESISHKYYGGVKPTIKITTSTGVFIEGSYVHPLLINRDGIEKWEQLQNIRKTDKVVQEAYQGDFNISSRRSNLPRAVPRSHYAVMRKVLKYNKMGLNNREITKLTNIDPMTVSRYVDKKHGKIVSPTFKAPCFMSKDMAYYLGLLAGDGSVTTYIALTSMDEYIKEFFIDYTKKAFNTTVHINDKKDTKAVMLRPNSNPFYKNWITQVFGGSCDADSKDVPTSIRMASFDQQLAFLQGLMDTDGSSDIKNKRAEISLNSAYLIDFICAMLSSLGIEYTRTLRNKSHRVSMRQAYNIHKLFRMDRKVQTPNKNKELPTLRKLLDIQTIEYGESEVYDLTNPTSHSFVANSLVVHNSTLLRYIAGLQTPTEGQVLIHAKPRIEDDRVGMVFQQYSSYPWLTVWENVALGLQYSGVPLKIRKEKAMEMIKKVGLEGHEYKYAQYPTLSGGQLQRVAIARSLVYDSKILLMDEPFGALDIETRSQMQDMLAHIWLEINPTIVFVTHDISEAVYLGDEIYVMRKNPGNIVGKFSSPLPYQRTRDMKRLPEFVNRVNEIEDFMITEYDK